MGLDIKVTPSSPTSGKPVDYGPHADPSVQRVSSHWSYPSGHTSECHGKIWYDARTVHDSSHAHLRGEQVHVGRVDHRLLLHVQHQQLGVQERAQNDDCPARHGPRQPVLRRPEAQVRRLLPEAKRLLGTGLQTVAPLRRRPKVKPSRYTVNTQTVSGEEQGWHFQYLLLPMM